MRSTEGHGTESRIARRSGEHLVDHDSDRLVAVQAASDGEFFGLLNRLAGGTGQVTQSLWLLKVATKKAGLVQPPETKQSQREHSENPADHVRAPVQVRFDHRQADRVDVFVLVIVLAASSGLREVALVVEDDRDLGRVGEAGRCAVIRSLRAAWGHQAVDPGAATVAHLLTAVSRKERMMAH